MAKWLGEDVANCSVIFVWCLYTPFENSERACVWGTAYFHTKVQRKNKKKFYMHMRGAVLWWIIWRKEGNVLFSDALNTFYLRFYGVRHMVKYHTDSERGNPLPPQGLLFPINSKGSFICTIPQTGLHIPRPCYTSRGALAGTRNSSMSGSFECIRWVFSVDVSLILTLPTYLNRLFTPSLMREKRV